MPDDVRDTSPDFDEIDYTELSDFFDRKGAVELISLLNSEGYRFDEIDDLLDVSRGYLNDRRDEAVHLGLIVPDQAYRDDTLRRVWTLTALGHYIRQRMRHLGLTESHERLVNARREYTDRKEEFLEWVDDPDEIQEYTKMMWEDQRPHPSELPEEMKEVFRQIDEDRF
ncbi:hypothetical protein [Natronobeatus ordinarius]|uniref:hypothetical protein n=1 Tax=Natronobeatus ordinarius TaxID=2963433 RepID=UPI0020CEB17B|nr:hypothetical protein [Natronobeatus ordinarius]